MSGCTPICASSTTSAHVSGSPREIPTICPFCSRDSYTRCMGRGQGTTQEQARDHFSDVFGDRRGTARGSEDDSSPPPPLEGPTAALMEQHLRSCGWGVFRGKDFENKARYWYVKEGHARVSRDGEAIGQRFTLTEALQSQIHEDGVLANGWVFRDCKWRHPSPPDGREHAYDN